MKQSERDALRGQLIRSLEEVYGLEAFSALAELLQGEALVLRALAAQTPRALSPSELSDRLHLSRSRITGALNSLRRKGLIRTEPAPADRRRLLVYLTEAGARRIAGQLDAMNAYFDRMIEGLGPAEARTLIELIDRCVTVMEGA